MINRRQAIKTIGGLAGMASLSKFLPACGSDDGPVGITTYVYLMLENRTYDNVFGARKLVEGLAGDGLTSTMSNADVNGAPIAPYEPANLVDHLCVPDPPHGWDSSRAQWNNGANDGFVRVHQMEHASTTLKDPMSYLRRKYAPISWARGPAFSSVCRAPTLSKQAASVLGVAVIAPPAQREGCPRKPLKFVDPPWRHECATVGVAPC